MTTRSSHVPWALPACTSARPTPDLRRRARSSARNALVGVSCYDDFALAQRLVAEGADYVAFGSFFPSAVKPGARRADVALLARGRGLPVPVVAIGGITAAGARPSWPRRAQTRSP